jgi:hypothetical protein
LVHFGSVGDFPSGKISRCARDDSSLNPLSRTLGLRSGYKLREEIFPEVKHTVYFLRSERTQKSPAGDPGLHRDGVLAEYSLFLQLPHHPLIDQIFRFQLAELGIDAA